MKKNENYTSNIFYIILFSNLLNIKYRFLNRNYFFIKFKQFLK